MPVAVPGNRWDLFDVPELGAWEPSLRVSVVIPYYENPDDLELTLAGLAQRQPGAAERPTGGAVRERCRGARAVLGAGAHGARAGVFAHRGI